MVTSTSTVASTVSKNKGTLKTLDANEAVASVAHRMSEMSVIYPITPSSPMGEFVDEWSAKGMPNIWGSVPTVMEMQSEAGAAGAVHGVLQAGSLATTYTASQGLLLMIPNMYKIAGEMLPFVMHVAARTIATHALSIFGDHSDVMAVRQTGFIMLCSNSVQEAHDLAAIAHAATLEARLPILHFFDGFRTSHEVGKIEMLEDDVLKELISDQAINQFRGRSLTPDQPVVRGTAQNPDVFFQCREAANGYYADAPNVVQAVMDRFARLTGRQYHLYEYEGDPDATDVVVVMGSGAETVETTADYLNEHEGRKTGVLKVRCYRPFDVARFADVLPASVERVAVLDRTKEPGATGEPLYQDVCTAVREAGLNVPTIINGRYGLSSKEFTPGMVKAVFDNLAQDFPKNHFTVGILDDITRTSLDWNVDFDIESDQVKCSVFYGLGSDGTVGANKNTIKIIGEETDNYAQGYFVYDSKKSGGMTISHLRFGPDPIRSPYLIGNDAADFVGCHQFVFTERVDIVKLAKPGATVLLNSPYAAEETWDKLPVELQKSMIEKQVKLFVIDALKVAKETGMGKRINTIMQTCFFAISGVLDRDEAIAKIKEAIEKTYGKKGREIVEKNFAAVDGTLANLHEIVLPGSAESLTQRPAIVPAEAPDFVQRITGMIMSGEGDMLPVSAFPVDGTWPVDTAQWEKRGIADRIPVWEPEACIQCNQCAVVCPHAAIRAKAYDGEQLSDAAANEHLPIEFKSVDYKAKDLKGNQFTIQVAPDDCTGCNLCVMACPAKSKENPEQKAINMVDRLDVVEAERESFKFFEELKPVPREKIVRIDAKGSQFFEPLFEFSGACAGCGETPYVKMLTQLFGDRMLIANATGCSSIYGGNLPTTPYAVNGDGRGPAWANSLFEDNAEFGFGLRLAVETRARQARELLVELADRLDPTLVAKLQDEAMNIDAKRHAIDELKVALQLIDSKPARRLLSMADNLVDKSVWMFGGDGWAYDIGYGGLDHVIAQSHDVNILVMDTEVYSNTGGQSSKATPLGAAAKFAASGKELGKKDLGLIAMSYGHVYVASVALGANMNHAVKALQEAQSYDGPSLVIAYSHCIAHGYELSDGLAHQKMAVDSGVWPLYRFDPRRIAEGKAPLQLDSKPGKNGKTDGPTVSDYMANENRFRMVKKQDPAKFERLVEQANKETARRISLYQQLAAITTESAPA